MSDTHPPEDPHSAYEAMKRQRDSMIRRVRDVTEDVARITAAPPPRVLVVDDNKAVLRSLAQSFRDLSGLEVVECDDAALARYLLETEDFAGVVLDLHLGHAEINGITLAESVHRNRVLVLVSADPGAAEAAESLRALHIGKPFRVHAEKPSPPPRATTDDVWVGDGNARTASVEEAVQEIMSLLRKSAS